MLDAVDTVMNKANSIAASVKLRVYRAGCVVGGRRKRY